MEKLVMYLRFLCPSPPKLHRAAKTPPAKPLTKGPQHRSYSNYFIVNEANGSFFLRTFLKKTPEKNTFAPSVEKATLPARHSPISKPQK